MFTLYRYLNADSETYTIPFFEKFDSLKETALLSVITLNIA